MQPLSTEPEEWRERESATVSPSLVPLHLSGFRSMHTVCCMCCRKYDGVSDTTCWTRSLVWGQRQVGVITGVTMAT